MTADSPLLFDPENRANLRVISGPPPASDPGAGLLAHAGMVHREALASRRRIRVACVGAVFTVPGARRQGHASRLLADGLARARRGSDLVLASGDGGLYRRQGMGPIPPLARFALPPHGEGYRSEVEAREAGPDDLDAMAALYDAEDVHFIRPRADWDRLWRAGRLMDAPATFSVLARAGRIVAYAVAQQHAGHPPGAARARRILEIAGDRDSIVAAAPRLADELLVPLTDKSTIGLCERAGWPRTTRQFPITAEAITPQGGVGVGVIPWYGLNYL